MLNAAGIDGPRGGAWSASTINGNWTRGTGILNNELYIGRLTWNRLAYVKDPETGRRRSRPRGDAERVVTEVPEQRIIDQTYRAGSPVCWCRRLVPWSISLKIRRLSTR